jgi:Zn-dependent M16 (insulinase) family peptidase
MLRAEPAICDPAVEGAGRPIEDRPVQTHAERMERLYRIIDRLLEKMESNVINNPNMTAQEQERAAKALTSTMTAMERMTDIADPKKAPETSDGGKTNDSAEAERMRREIAERLERLSAKLLDGAGKSE